LEESAKRQTLTLRTASSIRFKGQYQGVMALN